jgi:nucleotide-binding universal stress UspA family protein
MYRKILVPLDGSELAECVLPHVEAIAKGCQVTDIVFVRVAEPVQVPVAGTDYTFTDEDWRRIETEHRSAAEEYVKQLPNRLKYEGVGVQAETLTGGTAAEVIADYATKKEVDLIIIATHGRSGVSRWVWGSVADRVLRSACVPVLMVRAPGCVPGI